MFKQENRYVSRQANELIPVGLQLLMWNMIDELKPKIELDYLQIFRLKKNNNKVIMEHEQEVPAYKEQYELQEDAIFIEHNIKIYVIDSADYSTMILASKY